MDRVLVLGRGGAGKSVLARRVGAAVGAPVVELRPRVLSAVRDLAPTAELLVFRNPRATARWLELTQPNDRRREGVQMSDSARPQRGGGK